ncbi:MAG: T9SS type A sorting domain-containing protein [Balneolaceae bacterium]
MKRVLALLVIILSTGVTDIKSQIFDYYGPKPFGEILDDSFNKPWTPTALSEIENRKYFVLLNAENTHAATLDETDFSLEVSLIDAVHGATSTYGSLMRSIFQIVDINTHLANTETPLAGQYRMNPMLHKYFGLNADTDNSAIITDGGTRYINEAERTGYVLVEFDGTGSSTTIKAVNQWVYDADQDSVIEAVGWTPKWLSYSGTSYTWETDQGSASNFFLADANDLIDLEIEDGSAFNPVSVSYQPNATAALPEVEVIEETAIATQLTKDLDEFFHDQLGASESATAAASLMLDTIESTLTQNSAALRYPKEFYLALRENMLSHKIASSDIYGARLGYNTVPNVYFTNALDDNDVPHPFMVITAYAVSTRPNQLVDVNRPPGAQQGVGYAETTVTRDGKLGEFLIKIPLKDYGLIENLLDNDLSPYGDLASDFDSSKGTTTEKTVYNYAGLASVGVAVDGVTIYPAQNNNLRFAVEDGEVTHSGIHVGGGLELHYHADGHAYSGNGINLYNLSDYEGNNHPPVVGIAYDGIALFGKHEESQSSMIGYDISLDEFGGHDHSDGFGYHYHAHTQNVEAAEIELGPEVIKKATFFNEHFLLVGAWKGNINNIPGFDEGKLNQLKEDDIARYVGATYEAVQISSELDAELPQRLTLDQNYPNPFNPTTSIKYQLPEASNVKLQVFDLLGRSVVILVDGTVSAGVHTIEFDASGLSTGVYMYRLETGSTTISKQMMLIK